MLDAEGIADVESFVKGEVHRQMKGLQPYKRVREVVVTREELPRTRIGKLRRFSPSRYLQEY